MNLSRQARLAVWFVLLAMLGLAVYVRSDLIWQASPGPADRGLLAVFGLLLVMPLFSEIDIFGVKVRQQIEAAQKEIRSRVSEIQDMLAFAPGIAAPVSNSPNPLDDPGLERLRAEVTPRVSQGPPAQATTIVCVPVKTRSAVVAALALAHQAGHEMRRLRLTKAKTVPADGLPGAVLAWQLARAGVLDGETLALAREVCAIGAQVQNTGELSSVQERFIREMGPVLLGRLQAM